MGVLVGTEWLQGYTVDTGSPRFALASAESPPMRGAPPADAPHASARGHLEPKGVSGSTAARTTSLTMLPCSCEPLNGEKQICVGLRPGLKTAEEGTCSTSDTDWPCRMRCMSPG